MAYIKDYTYAADDVDVSSHTGVFPDYDVGDLLLWIVQKDSTAGTHLTVPSSWTAIYNTSGYNEFLICYKTATSSETAPQTSSDDTDAYQSCMLSIKNSSGIGSVNFSKHNEGETITTQTYTADTNTSIGGIVLSFASWSSTGGGTITSAGKSLVNEESSSLGMTICARTINDLSYNQDFMMQSSSDRYYNFFYFEILDDTNATPRKYGGEVNFNITPIEWNINDSSYGTTDKLSRTTVNGIAVDDINTVVKPGYTDKGVSYIQKAQYITVAKGTFFSGAEITFTTAQDLSAMDKFLVFNVYTDRPKYLPPIGNGEMGMFMYLTDTSGNYKVWNINSADSSVVIIVQDRSYIMDLGNTSFMDSTGTLDLTSIHSIAFGQQTRSMNSTYFDISRIYFCGKTEIFGGTVDIPSNLDTIMDHQTSAYMNSFLRQGIDYLCHLPLLIGGTNDVYFDESEKTIEFPKSYDLDSRYLNYHVRDNHVGVDLDPTSSSTIKLKNMKIIGNLAIYFRVINSNGSVDLSGSIFYNIGIFNLNSNTILDNGNIRFSAKLTLNGATVTNTTFSNVIPGSSFVEYDQNSIFNKNVFSSFGSGYGLYVPASVTGPITIDNIISDGSGIDVYWAGTSGTLTVNLINGSNLSTSATAGGSVNIQNTKNFKFTVSPSITGYEWHIYQIDTLGSLSNPVELAGEESATSDNQTYTYSYTSDINIAVQLIAHTNDFIESITYYVLGDQNQNSSIDLIKDNNN